MKVFFQPVGILVLMFIVLIGWGMIHNNSVAKSPSVSASGHTNSTNSKATHSKQDKTNQPSRTHQSAKKVNKKSSTPSTDVTHLTNKQWEEKLAKNNFMGPSDGPYPVIHKGENIWIDANVSKERVYIKNGNKTIYTMLTSSGLDTSPDTSTPRGTFYVQAERGKSFYSASEQEGANYWTSWKNHGEFLFHTIPTDKNGNYIMSEAEKLGQKASHGCFRLAVLDAKWINENIPVGTKVVVHA